MGWGEDEPVNQQGSVASRRGLIPLFFSVFWPPVLVSISGCAFDVSFVKTVPTNFTADTGCRDKWVLSGDQQIGMGTGFPTKLRQGTKWRCVGHVEAGDVFQTTDQIVTVEASNIYEALIVAKGDQLMGFYLPLEKKLAPVDPPIKLIVARETNDVR